MGEKWRIIRTKGLLIRQKLARAGYAESLEFLPALGL